MFGVLENKLRNFRVWRCFFRIERRFNEVCTSNVFWVARVFKRLNFQALRVLAEVYRVPDRRPIVKRIRTGHHNDLPGK